MVLNQHADDPMVARNKDINVSLYNIIMYILYKLSFIKFFTHYGYEFFFVSV